MTPWQLESLNNRRRFLTHAGMGLGAAALGSLVTAPLFAAAQGTTQSRTLDLPPGCHHVPKAKRVIFLFMAGAPSQVDLFDYKPDLAKQSGQPLPKSVSNGQRVTAMTRGKTQLVVPSRFQFRPSGDSGLMISELLPNLATQADKLCLVKSMNTESINHDPGKSAFSTGSEIPGRPSMGAWLSYGLGSLNRDLPDYIVMPSAFWGGKVNVQALYARLWGSGFLPSKHQGTSFQTTGDPVLFLSNPQGIDASVRRRMLDSLGQLNQKHFGEIGDPEIETTIAQQEMAFRMQSSVPELTDISGRIETDFGDVWTGSAQTGILRSQLPPGPSDGRTRCSIHPVVPPRLGPPFPTFRKHESAMQRCRSTNRRTPERP